MITKHNRPVAMLTGIASPHLRIGLRIGKGGPKPMFKQATKGAYLATLTEDREER